MLCPNCGHEMKSGYSIHPGIGGFIKVVKLNKLAEENYPLLQLSICPECGKAEFFVDPEKVKDQVKV